MKRQWVIYFDGNLNTPWIARPEKGAKIFFGAADALVRFLIDGDLDVEVIRCASDGHARGPSYERP